MASLLAPPPAVSPASATTHVLLVDDVPQNLIAMEALLAKEDVSVLSAASGAEALELLLNHDVALALLDVQMPEMDGFALAELMRGASRTRHVPIIFLTASPNDPARSFKGYETGAVDFLHKPIEPHIILGKVRVFIQLHRQRLALEQQNEQLERALELNQTMMAVMTHDLRTPLSAINLCAEQVMDEADGTPMARHATFIKSSAVRMSRMIDQMLDFSRIRSSILTLDIHAADLGNVCEEVVAEIRRAHPGQPVVLTREGDLRGGFDVVRMGQVVGNLLGNAVQYGGGDTIAIHADGSHADMLHCVVRNAGHIDDALLPRLFEPFKGGFNRSTGLGLGLYIVDQFVRAHGGSVRAVNSKAGVCFDFRFPRRRTAGRQDDRA
ncbi:hybrid sensor histidine kinase/response regulator [Luteibacter sp. PPL201]|uniref:histidine kinase n=1 Tax=Luteibacter sahnii TaxID=3021977 RepID=A0ABT6BEF2_9GAMM|nr:hybrid sensor histidine kinase/response regulator [Luteibacter sp. PPL193]MDY1547537.1 hybrid sensor histidine kinase/response regulator [Luteibacter sp. PPL193]